MEIHCNCYNLHFLKINVDLKGRHKIVAICKSTSSKSLRNEKFPSIGWNWKQNVVWLPVVDPAFPRREEVEERHIQSGVPTYNLANFPENCIKMRTFRPRMATTIHHTGKNFLFLRKNLTLFDRKKIGQIAYGLMQFADSNLESVNRFITNMPSSTFKLNFGKRTSASLFSKETVKLSCWYKI